MRPLLSLLCFVAACASTPSQPATTPVNGEEPSESADSADAVDSDATGETSPPSRASEEAAAQTARVALRRECTAPAPPPSAEASRRLDVALAALDRGDMDSFREGLLAAAEVGSAQAHYNLGYYYGQQGNLVLAHGHLVKALAMDPCYHIARLELGRYFIDGMGVAPDPAEGVRAMQRVVAEAPPEIAAVARVNLAMAFLYGLGVERDYDSALAQLRAALPHPLATELLAELPTPDPWVGVALEPPRPLIPPVVAVSAEGWIAPDWTREGTPIDADGSSFSGTYAADRKIAVGVPVDGEGPMELESAHECLEVRDGRVSVATRHTNREACSWQGRLTRRLSDGTFVATAEGPVAVLDASTGRESSVSRCHVHVEIGETRAELVADWPRGCAAARCGRRAYPTGHRFEPVAAGESCEPSAGASSGSAP